MSEAEYTHDDIAALVPALALGALDADEARQVQVHLAACSRCAAELLSYEEVADALLLTPAAQTPPDRLKQRLLASAAPPAPARAAAQTGWRLGAALRSLWAPARWQPISVALLALLLIANVLLWQRPVPDVGEWQPLTLVGSAAAPEATGLMVISDDGRHGSLVVDALPELPPTQQYQLWLIVDGTRVSGGIFSVDAEGYGSLWIAAPRALSEYDAFGITIEPAGGSPGPTGTRVLGFNL